MDIRIIIRLHEYLTSERTGAPKELASKLGISERSLYNYIAYMKSEMNAPIRYNMPFSSSYAFLTCPMGITNLSVLQQ